MRKLCQYRTVTIVFYSHLIVSLIVLTVLGFPHIVILWGILYLLIVHL